MSKRNDDHFQCAGCGCECGQMNDDCGCDCPCCAAAFFARLRPAGGDR